MSGCRICSWLTGRGRGQIQDLALRKMHAAGPRDSFRRIVPLLRGRILEIGCGTGILFDDYPSGVAVTGVEPDGEFLELARRNAARSLAVVRVVSGDAQRLPFAEGVFDAAVIQFVLCSVPNPAAALGEVLRVLRPGGLLYLYEHVASSHRLYRFIQDWTAPVVAWMAEGCHWNRDTAALVRSFPIRIENEERGVLRKGLMPPLPILRLVGRSEARRDGRGALVRESLCH